MTKSWLTIAVALSVVAVALSASGVTRAQGARQFEYTRVHSYHVSVPGPQGARLFKDIGYRACLATDSEWSCREFVPKVASDDGLHMALAALGSEGWELVSVVEDDRTNSSGYPIGTAYLFKRQR